MTVRRGKEILSLALFGALFLLLAAAGLAATEERAHITVAESGSFSYGDQTFFGRGDVEITYKDVVLRGDELYIDLASGELQLMGNVLLRQDGQDVRGDFLTYNLETGEGTFSEVRSEIELAGKTGFIFMRGDSLQITDQVYQVHNAQFTTCDQEERHYHVAAKELELIVGERVVIRKVTYYEGSIPIFYWPYLVIPLDTEAEERFFSLPVFGFSEREGYFMKNTFNYQLNPNHYGDMYVDLFSRLGVAAGVRHHYALTSWGDGSLYFYHLPHQTDPILEGAWQHAVGGEKWNFSTDTSYRDSWLRKSLNSTNRFNITLPRLTADGTIIYRNNPQQRETKYLEYRGDWQQTLSDNLRLNLRGNWTERIKDEQSLKLLNYLAETRYRRDKHTLTLAVEQQYNPDLLTDKTSSWRTVQRLPELKWEVNDLGLRGFPLRSLIQVGRYGERPSLIQKSRVLGQLALGTKVWRPTSKLTINYHGEGGAAIYQGGEKQGWLYGRATLNQRFIQNMTFNAVYSQREVWGQSAFRFDAKTPLQTVTGRLSYNRPTFSTTLSGGYDFRNKRFHLLTLQGNWRPNQNWDFSLLLYHDLGLKKTLGVLPIVEYRAGETRVKVAANYSPSDNVLKRIDSQIALSLGVTWQIGYTGIYEPLKGAFAQGRVTLSKDLHCRAISASYDHVNKRVALQYTIKAFPTLPIGWDSLSGLELFELDDIGDLVGMEE